MVVERRNKEKIKELKYDDALEFKKTQIASVFDTVDGFIGESEEVVNEKRYVDDSESEEAELEVDRLKGKVSESALERIKALRKKANAARNDNREAVEEENKNNLVPNLHKKKAAEEYRKAHEKMKVKLSKQGVTEDKEYLTDQLNKIEHQKNELLRKKRQNSFGWEVFNQDSLYRAHDKRVAKTGFDEKLYEDQMRDINIGFKERVDKVEQLKKMVEDQQKKRKQFSKVRAVKDDRDRNFINESNRVFNEKAARFFEKEAAEIKANLERNGAL